MTLHSLHCAVFTLNSHEGRAATGKRNLVSMRAGPLQSFPTLRPCKLWPARLLCQGFLQARIQEGIGQYWLPYPSRALYFLPPSPPTPLSVWCCQNPCDTSSYTTSTAGPHRGKPKSSRAASGAIPSG